MCQAVADTVRSTLGPRGMDKLMHDGRSVTISNDGATIMRLLDIVHPAAKTLVDISLSQVCIMPFPRTSSSNFGIDFMLPWS